METTVHKNSRFQMSDHTKGIIVDLIAYLFAGVFIYTASDKFWDIQTFIKFMSKLDIIGPVGPFAAWAIPITEIIISIFLLLPSKRYQGLIASCGLMVVFTIYLTYMKLTAEQLPCHCGGVIALLSWRDHIWLNIILVALSALGIKLFKKE